ncbi:bifunctional tetrahydrofolate synthase/dihydrofolate synthase [Ideonella livida]|uniref:Dihydrofolate synthase/folylpolyglutamate synthase n=1 Tax=Ideonella livida TaxID=2707176 RepID=A0A7C9TJP0_9BURK|nr:bifunctional tetrahydrofolate synthase/dihydrofolate synthase [Ideonella livida]NDY92141.1 bifunctional tetrahydrofolate synthase/dihydrofolate synthase [Ideonella livida]
MPKTLQDWLAHCEQLHPTAIDMSLDRVREVKARLDLRFDCPVISVAGTNGKGSTCAMLDSMARAAGWRVGLYSKPHLVHFEERCRLDGEMIAAEALVPHFEAVEAARQGVTLTYFEFTTLAIIRALSQARLDLVVLEVGLGGRLDAVNVIDADCAVITGIDIDHVAFLGPDRESIGREKAGIFRSGRPAVVGDLSVPASVLEVAREVGADLRLAGRDFSFSGDRQQWSWTGRQRRLHGMAPPALRGSAQLLNASTALAALECLQDRVPVTAQAVRQGLALVELAGRFQVLPGQPTIILDVAHNDQSVAALARNLDELGFAPRTHAVFGAMHDKDLGALVQRMAPLVDHWHLTDLPLARAAKAADLAGLVEAAPRGAGVPAARAACHATPQQALVEALRAADPTDRIVVFGSFYTVGGVLAGGLPSRGSIQGV